MFTVRNVFGKLLHFLAILSANYGAIANLVSWHAPCMVYGSQSAPTGEVKRAQRYLSAIRSLSTPTSNQLFDRHVFIVSGGWLF